MKVQIAALTDAGSVRQVNEDTISVLGWRPINQRGQPSVMGTQVERPELILLADGMGGHAYGERASELVVQYLNRNVDRLSTELETVLAEADAELLAVAEREPDTKGMGTT